MGSLPPDPLGFNPVAINYLTKRIKNGFITTNLKKKKKKKESYFIGQ
jgi:hypothetical protein